MPLWQKKEIPYGPRGTTPSWRSDPMPLWQRREILYEPQNMMSL